MSEYTSSRRITVMEFREARHPAERSAALMLAVAQRDLAIARASSPADVADDPRVTDPVAEYAAWLDRMVVFERWARAQVEASIVAGYEYDHARPRAVGPLAEVTASAIRRARAAIALMTGIDPVAAAAAREDVLHGWSEDDRLAEWALGSDPYEEGRP